MRYFTEKALKSYYIYNIFTISPPFWVLHVETIVKLLEYHVPEKRNEANKTKEFRVTKL